MARGQGGGKFAAYSGLRLTSQDLRGLRGPPLGRSSPGARQGCLNQRPWSGACSRSYMWLQDQLSHRRSACYSPVDRKSSPEHHIHEASWRPEEAENVLYAGLCVKQRSQVNSTARTTGFLPHIRAGMPCSPHQPLFFNPRHLPRLNLVLDLGWDSYVLTVQCKLHTACTYTCTCACVSIYIYTHISIYRYICIDTWIHAYIHTYINQYIHAYTCVYIYIHACVFAVSQTHSTSG